MFAISQYFHETGRDVPVMVSGTFDKEAERSLVGKASRHSGRDQSFSIVVGGMNCALGPDIMRPHLEELAKGQFGANLLHPNAGLPNEMGQFDLPPPKMADYVEDFAREGWLNIVGGCCGTTPEYIHAISQRIKGIPARQEAEPIVWTRLSGQLPQTSDQ